MARGFESKDVEYQQAEAERKRSGGTEMRGGDREAQSKRKTIELSLARAPIWRSRDRMRTGAC